MPEQKIKGRSLFLLSSHLILVTFQVLRLVLLLNSFHIAAIDVLKFPGTSFKLSKAPRSCLFQCQNQPSPPVPSHSPPQAQCPPALALSPPRPPVLVQPGFLPKFLLVAGTMQSSGLLWPTDSPPPPPLEVRPRSSSSDTCLERFRRDFAASRTTKCY